MRPTALWCLVFVGLFAITLAQSDLPDWAFCTDSSQCADGCCSKYGLFFVFVARAYTSLLPTLNPPSLPPSLSRLQAVLE
jgi:hypothetical protein